MKLPFLTCIAALVVAVTSSAQVTSDRIVLPSDIRFESVAATGETEIHWTVRYATQLPGPVDMSMIVCVLVNGNLDSATPYQLAASNGGGGQTCNGSCPGDCTSIDPLSTCEDFSGYPGSHGCACAAVVCGGTVVHAMPFDQVTVELVAAANAVAELYLPNDRATVIFSDVYPNSCNGDGGNQMGCTNCPCMNNAPAGTIGGCLNSAGTGVRLTATGDASVSLPPMSNADLRFGLSGAPGGAFCILNSGNAVAPQNIVNPCFGMNSGAQSLSFDGLRCAIQNTRRHGGRSADAAGDVGATNNPWGGEGGPPIGLANAFGGFPAGQTRYFQTINRDNVLLSCMRGLNTSQAVEVTFTP